MNKSEMIEELAAQANVHHKVAETIINLVINSMKEALINNDRIELRGFGSFHIEHYDAYIGRNPKTGDSIKVPPKKLPFFKVGKEFKEKINSKFLSENS